MLEIIVYGLIWCFAIYGILVIVQEIIHKSTYKKIEDNINLIVTVKNVENGIETYIRELTNVDRFYNNLVVIDLESEDETMCILKELEKDNENLHVLNRIEGENYLKMQVG